MACALSSMLQFIISPAQSWFHLENPQILVENLATTIVTLQLLQYILHRVRFRSEHCWSVQWAAWAAFYLPVPLAALAVAVMLLPQRFLCPYWLVAVLFAAGQADTMAAYGLRDDLRIVRRFAKRALYLAYLIVLFQNWDCQHLRWMEILSLVLGFLVVLQDLKISGRDMTPSSDICKAASDHVRCQVREPSFCLDDDGRPEPQASVVTVGSLESYRSAVSGCTTLEDIRTTNIICSRRLEDACLSSALFLQLLQRRDTTHHHHQVVDQPSSASHAFKDVLWTEGATRAFRLIEVQLSLMYDYFFSTHGSPSRTSYRLYATYSILKISFLLSVRSVMPDMEKKQGRVTLYTLIFLELCLFIRYLTSNGYLVSYMCDHKEDLGGDTINDPGDDDSVLSFPLNVLLYPLGWKRKAYLEQYSLIEDFNRRPGDRRKGIISYNDCYKLRTWICRKLVNPSEPQRFAFDGPLSDMRVSECESLHLLSSSLRRQETTIHTILVWHIATWFCAMDVITSEDKKPLINEMFFPSEYTFALMLSKYCAYLVAFRPELLPEHPALTKSIFEEAVRQVERHFPASDMSPEQRYRYINPIPVECWTICCSDKVFLEPGFLLGQDLMVYRRARGSSECWKVMAEFWVEMTLFLAQSGNADAHVEQLARGGPEFLTRLRALLSNGWDRSFIRRSDDDGDWRPRDLEQPDCVIM